MDPVAKKIDYCSVCSTGVGVNYICQDCMKDFCKKCMEKHVRCPASQPEKKEDDNGGTNPA